MDEQAAECAQADAQAEESIGLTDRRAGRQSRRRKKNVLAVREFRIQREVIIKIVVKTNTHTAARLTDTG